MKGLIQTPITFQTYLISDLNLIKQEASDEYEKPRWSRSVPRGGGATSPSLCSRMVTKPCLAFAADTAGPPSSNSQLLLGGSQQSLEVLRDARYS